MAIKLNSGAGEARPVEIGGGATVWVRPATAYDHETASQRAADVLRAVLVGEDARQQLQDVLGVAVRADGTEITAAVAQRYAAVHLAMQCIERWDGIETDDGRPAPVEMPYVALLMRDEAITRRIEGAMLARIHEVTAEGEGLPRSPDGASGAGAAFAKGAGKPENLALRGTPPSIQ